MRTLIAIILGGCLFGAQRLAAQDSTWIKRDVEQYGIANDLATYREAADYLANYLNEERRGVEPTAYTVELYHKMALWYYLGGDLRNTLRYLDTTLALRETVREVSLTELARTQYLKGQALLDLNAFRPASEWFDRGLVTLQRAISAGDSLGTNLTRIQNFTRRSTELATQLFDFDKARLLLGQLPRLDQRAQQYGNFSPSALRLQRIATHIAEGLYWQKRRDFAKAEAAFLRGLEPEFLADPKMENNVFISRSNLGYNQYLREEYSLAEQTVRSAIRDLEPKVEEHRDYPDHLAGLYGYLVMIQRATGQYAALNTALAQGLRWGNRFHQDGKGRKIGTLYTYAAAAAADQGAFGRADSLFRLGAQALVDGYRPTAARALPIIADRTLYAQEEVIELLEYWREAERQSFAAGDPAGLDRALAVSRSLDTLLRRGRQQLNLTASVGQFIDREQGNTVAAVDIALHRYRLSGRQEDLAVACQFIAGQKSNILRKYLLGTDLAGQFGLPSSLTERKRNLDLRVLVAEENLRAAGPETNAGLRADLLRLHRELDEVREEIVRDYPAFTRAMRGYDEVDYAAVAESLADDRLVVEYFLSADSIYLYTVSRAAGLAVRVIPRPAELAAGIASLADADGNVVALQPDQAAGATDNWFSLLLGEMVPPGITRLQLIPDGELWALPFAALRTPNNRFLIEEYALSYGYALPLLFDDDLKAAAEAGEEVYQGYGIDYQDILRQISRDGTRSGDAERLRDLGSLVYASREVEAAADIIGGRYLLNEKATKERFLADASRARILHLSMHGLLAENPLESALVFQGQAAAPYELLRMNEILANRYPAELTVLSACHTGGGPLQTAEGVQSIGRAFTAAGSRSTITSSWAARDQATHDILLAFYRHLEDGVPRDVALQRGVREYLQRGSAADRRPVNWANLTLTGAIGPVQAPGSSRYVWIVVLAVALGAGGAWAWRHSA